MTQTNKELEDRHTNAVLNLLAITKPDDHIIDFIHHHLRIGYGVWSTAKRLYYYLDMNKKPC